jgi:hypothetical protein
VQSIQRSHHASLDYLAELHLCIHTAWSSEMTVNSRPRFAANLPSAIAHGLFDLQNIEYTTDTNTVILLPKTEDDLRAILGYKNYICFACYPTGQDVTISFQGEQRRLSEIQVTPDMLLSCWAE